MKIDWEQVSMVWGILTAIAGGIGTLYWWLVLRPARRKEHLAESKKNERVSNEDGNTAILESLKAVRETMAEMQLQDLEKDRIISDLNQTINKFETAVDMFRMECTSLCGKEEDCLKRISNILDKLHLKIMSDVK